MRLCAVQFAPQLARSRVNAERAAEEIHLGADEGAELVVLPEAALTGYVFESRREALEAAVLAEGEEIDRLASACRSAGVWGVCGAIERQDEALFNAVYLIGPDGLLGRYRKTHTLCLGADRFTTRGSEPFRVYELPFGTIGLHICYDGSFPETARALRVLGAQLLILPTNWPDLRLKREMVQVRAYENHAFYLAVNRVGSERGVRFEGGSCLADPLGRLLMTADDEAGRHHAELDVRAADPTRVVIRPGEYELDYVADRRPDLYGPLAATWPDARGTGSRGAPS